MLGPHRPPHDGRWLPFDLQICHTFSCSTDLKTIIVCPPGFHAASPVRKWVHAPGISPESSEEGGGQEDALQRFHHEWMVSPPQSVLIFSFTHQLQWADKADKDPCLRKSSSYDKCPPLQWIIPVKWNPLMQPRRPALSSCIHLKWKNNLKKMSLVCRFYHSLSLLYCNFHSSVQRALKSPAES